jgi:hypothetical protein
MTAHTARNATAAAAEGNLFAMHGEVGYIVRLTPCNMPGATDELDVVVRYDSSEAGYIVTPAALADATDPERIAAAQYTGLSRIASLIR